MSPDAPVFAPRIWSVLIIGNDKSLNVYVAEGVNEDIARSKAIVELVNEGKTTPREVYATELDMSRAHKILQG